MSPTPLRLRVTPPIGEPFEHLCEADSIVVGRSSKADLVLSDRFLSRQHARFYREGEGDPGGAGGGGHAGPPFARDTTTETGRAPCYDPRSAR